MWSQARVHRRFDYFKFLLPALLKILWKGSLRTLLSQKAQKIEGLKVLLYNNIRLTVNARISAQGAYLISKGKKGALIRRRALIAFFNCRLR